MKSCLFPDILSFFHRRGGRHYIRAVKGYNENHSMLYTLIVKSLIRSWDNFEQNAKMLARCSRLILCLTQKMTSSGPEIIIKMSPLLSVSNGASGRPEEPSLEDIEVLCFIKKNSYEGHPYYVIRS